jgi:hypothetical protein
MYALAVGIIFSLALAQEKSFPAKGDNGEVGGIFGLGKGGIPKLNTSPTGPSVAAKGSEAPKPGPRLTNGGSGPYKAGYVSDTTLPKHTIYAPKTPPSVKMPVIVWGNGGCFSSGTMFEDFLTEIASYGYLILANGNAPKRSKASDPLADTLASLGSLMTGSQTKVSMLTDSIDWVTKGNGKKYGDIDTSKIAVAGQSCGGLEA